MNINDALSILGLKGEVTATEIKTAYRRKVKEFHPDRNPSGLQIMKLINLAYEMVKDLDHVVIDDDLIMTDYPGELSEAINAIINIDELIIEVCGLWVWVNGNTKNYKDILKTAGFKWAHKKKMWFFRPAKAASRNKNGKTWSINRIRDTYGSGTPKKEDRKRLA